MEIGLVPGKAWASAPTETTANAVKANSFFISNLKSNPSL
jgi:hypothetical protein